MAEHPIQGLMGVTIEKIRDMVNAETIIGDCLQAEEYFRGQPMTRSDGHHCYLGYHRQRNLAAITDRS